MPEFKSGCQARGHGGNHEHCCFLEPEHGGMHACFCGVWWDEKGRIKLRTPPRSR